MRHAHGMEIRHTMQQDIVWSDILFISQDRIRYGRRTDDWVNPWKKKHICWSDWRTWATKNHSWIEFDVALADWLAS
jgi:hypothetical protein